MRVFVPELGEGAGCVYMCVLINPVMDHLYVHLSFYVFVSRSVQLSITSCPAGREVKVLASHTCGPCSIPGFG